MSEIKTKIKKTVLMMGYSCNNKCIFCYNDHKRDKQFNRDTKEIMEEMYHAHARGTTYIELIGGEPSMRKDFIQLVRFAKQLGFETIMFATNGRMLSYKPFAEKVIEAGANHIVFSIHGHTAELHDALTLAAGSFNELLRGLENVMELGLARIGSNTTIVKQNYNNLTEIGSLIYSLGIRNSEFIFVDPTHGAPKDNFEDMVPTYEEVAPAVNKLLRFGEERNVGHWHIRYYLLCKLEEGLRHRVSELGEKDTIDTEHIAPDFVNKNVSKARENVGRTTDIPFCRGCEYNNLCEGPWREYLKHRPVE
ncbi:MAG: radical SAM protein [bacterium]|nr:radical SAM protein [bacterium]